MKKLISGMVALLLCLSCVGCSASYGTSNNEPSTALSSASDSSETNQKEIYSDKFVSISFVKKYGIPGMNGMLFFDLKAENKSGNKITIYLQDAYMNDVQFQAGSGTPLDLLPNKNAVHAFTGKYEGTKIKSVDEVKKIGFKIVVMDESSKVLETTKPVEINF